MSFTITLLVTISTKNSQKKMYFQKPGRNNKNLEEILKTRKKFPKTYGHPAMGYFCFHLKK